MRARPSYMAMSRRDHPLREAADDARGSMRDAHAYLAARRDEASSAKNVGKTFVTALGTAVGAGGVGWLAGRMGTTSIGTTGVPLGLVAGAAGHALVMFDLLPKAMNEHVQNVSNGAISGWIALWGAGQGGRSREKAGGIDGPITMGRQVEEYQEPRQMAPPYAPTMRQMGAPGVPQYVRGQAPGPLSEAELQAMSRAL